MTRLERLMMRVALIDQVTGPANKLMGTIDKLTSRAKVGFVGMATGGAELFAVSYAFNTLTKDARDFQNAVREVKSLSISDEALQHLEKTALSFSIRYGQSAADFVRSSYDIQSAISGLAGNELATFTEAGNLLAKGTKSDAATITNYMGTMYGIFKNTADSMGKSRWVQILAGQTATAVEMFKTTGNGMSDAFKTIGADAQSQGITLNEQMAVLGTLQSTMAGQEAGTKFRAFLVGIGAAQKQLGISLTDSTGKMLPIVDVLDKLKARVGGLGAVNRANVLKKAFGSDEAVSMVNLLMNDTDGLAKSIDKLGRVTGMDKARMMASAMVDPLDRLAAANTAVRISFGKVINQAMTPFYDSSIQALSTLNRWITMFPHVTKLVAKIAIAFLAFSAAVALFAIAKGIFIVSAAGINAGLIALRFALIPFGPLLSALRVAWLIFNIQLAAGTGFLPALRIAFLALNTQLLINFRSLSLVRAATWLATVTMGFLRAAALATIINFSLMTPTLLAVRAGFLAGATGAWAFTAALLANPITWIVLGVVALIAGLVLLVTHWDTVKAAVIGFVDSVVARWKWLRGIIEDNAFLSVVFAPLLLGVDIVTWLIGSFQKIPEWFAEFKNWLAGAGVFSAFSDGVDWIEKQWSNFRAMLEDNAFLKLLFAPLALSVTGVNLLMESLKKIPDWFAEFKNWLEKLNPFDALGKGVDWLIDKLNLIPGVKISKGELAAQPKTVSAVNTEQLPVMQQFTPIPGVTDQKTANASNYVERAATPVNQAPILLTKLPEVKQSAPVVNVSTQLSQPAPIVNLPPQPTQPAPVVNLSPQLTQPAPVVNLPPQLTQPAPVVNLPPQLSQPVPVVNLPPQLTQPAPVVHLPPQLSQPAAANNVIEMPRALTQSNPVERTNTISEKTTAQRADLAPPKINISQHVPAGGLRDQISNNDSSKTVKIDKIEVNTTQAVNGYSLADELKMAGG